MRATVDIPMGVKDVSTAGIKSQNDAGASTSRSHGKEFFTVHFLKKKRQERKRERNRKKGRERQKIGGEGQSPKIQRKRQKK